MITATIPSGSSGGVSGEQYFTTAIGGNLNDAFTIATGGAASLGLHVEPPPGARIVFEGSWMGNEWNVVTLREMGSNGYVTFSEVHEDYIGSVASLRFFRVRVIRQGTGEPGHITGKFSNTLSTIEGIEHGYMPHKIGAAVQAKSFEFTQITSNGTIALPLDATRKLVVTDIHFTVADVASVVIFSDGSLADSKYIFRGNMKPVGGASIFVPISYTLPHVFSGTNRPLCFTQSAAATVDGVVHYYESEP